jgi:hypothetical protein
MIINLTGSGAVVPLTALMLTACVSIRRSEGASDKTWGQTVKAYHLENASMQSRRHRRAVGAGHFSYQAAAMPAATPSRTL